jgi:hypothetical protein
MVPIDPDEDHLIMRKYLIAVLVFLAFPVFYPREKLISPNWVVHVVDENDQPVAAAKVLEQWTDESIDSIGRDETKLSGTDGIVNFEPHTDRASIVGRAYGCLVDVISLFYHASCGAHASMSVSKCNFGYLKTDENRAAKIEDYWNDGPRQVDVKLFLRHCPQGDSGFECQPDILNIACRDEHGQ